jgi:hypothetical protein
MQNCKERNCKLFVGSKRTANSYGININLTLIRYSLSLQPNVRLYDINTGERYVSMTLVDILLVTTNVKSYVYSPVLLPLKYSFSVQAVRRL